jgi:hypothetical protein
MKNEGEKDLSIYDLSGCAIVIEVGRHFESAGTDAVDL